MKGKDMGKSLPLLAALFTGVILLTAIASAADEPAAALPDAPTAVLHGSASTWRVLYSLNAPPVVTEEGIGEPGGDKGRKVTKTHFDFMTIHPPDGWTAVDFDDAGWCREHFGKYYNGELDSRAGSGGPNLNIRQISLRGKFTVTDPAKAGAVSLKLLFRGGAAVYLNGTEIARAHLAKDAKPGQPGEIYPDKAYLKPDGKPWHWFTDREAIDKEGVYEMRVRRIETALPGKLLRKGTNVLAVEVHAAPFPAAFADPKVSPPWCSAGVCEVLVTTTKPDVVIPNVDRPAGVQVWNLSVAEEVRTNDYGDPHESIRPVRLVAARNASAAGRVMVSSSGPIKGLSASLPALAGPNTRKLPASAVKVRYGRMVSLNGSAVRDDAMLETPDAEVAPPPIPPRDNWTQYRHKARTDDALPPEPVGGAYQSVSVTVEVPADAAPGDYRGELAISAEGLKKPVTVPVELTVADWTMPDPADFAFWFGLVQSPEGVAMPYQAKLWSDEHVKLMDKSFELIATTGGKVLFIILTAETEYGNEWSMAVWEKGSDGKLTADLSAVEKFVGAAAKHIRPTFVPVLVWQWPDFGKAPRITVRDAKTGELSNVLAPANGTDESVAFWQPVLTGVKGILDKAGLGERMLLATGSDRYPKKETVAAFAKAAPGVAWEAHRHFPTSGEAIPGVDITVPVKYIASVWGQWTNWDPDTRRAYGWKYTAGNQGTLWTWLDRGTYDPAAFTRFRTMCEQVILADRRGLAQIGADFWPAPLEKPGAPARGTLYSRFPHSANVGGGNKGCTTNQLFYHAPTGPVPTIRYQLIRENIQECEARIFLEKLLTADRGLQSPDKAIGASTCPLPEALAAKCQSVLDERTRWHRIGYSLSTDDVGTFWPYSGWQERTLKLFQAAGEAAKAAGKPVAAKP